MRSVNPTWPHHINIARNMNDHVIPIVSGLPRTGTSLMMQMIHAGGIPALTDKVRAGDEDNPRGYLELEAVQRPKPDVSWLAEAEGRFELGGDDYRSRMALAALIPIKRDLTRTDALIDKIVYRIYGLTAAEIEVIERPQYEQALSQAKSKGGEM